MTTARPTIQRLTAGLLAGLLAAGLTACGGSDGSTAADVPAPAASDASGGSSTMADPSDPVATESAATYDDGGQVDPQQFADRIKAGIARTTSAHTEFTMTGGGADMSGEGDTDYSGAPAKMRMSMTFGGQSMEMLLVEQVMYLQTPQSGDRYLAYDLDDPDNPLGARFSEQLDPAASMQAFVRSLTSVVSAGTEDVDGRRLDHYVMTIDTSEVARSGSAGSLPPEIRADVWLDGQDRMAKTSMDLGVVTYEAVLSDFGKPVRISAPSDDQVVTPPSS